ncbi:rod shape-determining protein MreC [Candidatus Desantisbacteria bacterium]|nr:rod shape-determining protein MreC [Candidatus Desantisbacteria bacterium]
MTKVLNKTTRKYFSLIFFLLFSIILLTTQINRPPRTSLIKKTGLWILAPFQKVAIRIEKEAREIYADIAEFGYLRKENKKLKKYIDKYKQKERIYSECFIENKRLRKLLNLSQHYQYSLISSEVVGKDPTNWFNTILIDKGSKNGIKENMVVISTNGVIGKIIEVSKSRSKVQLILDINSAVGAIIERSRAIGVLKGFSEKVCRLEYISRMEDIKHGDIVSTSGLGGIFPKGLPLGVVSKIEKKNYGLFQNVEVVPYVNFYKIEEVLIIENPGTFMAEE